jgi:hypothetical protein
MNVHPQTATYRALIFCIKNDNRIIALSNAAQDGYEIAAQFFYPTRLHRPLITVPPALTGAAITVLALAEPFIAAGAAVAFIRCCLLFFKGAHGLVVPPRHGTFFLQKKN